MPSTHDMCVCECICVCVCVRVCVYVCVCTRLEELEWKKVRLEGKYPDKG